MKKYNELTIEIIAVTDVTSTSSETEFIPFDNDFPNNTAYEFD